MVIPEWLVSILSWLLSTVGSAALIAVGVWLARNLIVTRLTKSVQHEFDRKLAKLQGELRETEIRLTAELNAKETQIAVLRGTAISALTNHQMALDKRRLKAVDQLWSAVISLGKARPLITMMGLISFTEIAKRAERDPKVREFVNQIGFGFEPKSLELGGAAEARPFVTPMVWATYSALMAIAAHAVISWLALRGGLGKAEDFVGGEAINKLIKAVLPHCADYIDEHGAKGYHLLIEQLDDRLLHEIRKMLSGEEADTASVAQAAAILRLSEQVMAESSEQGGYSGVTL